MDRVLEVEPGDVFIETKLVANLEFERRLELATNEAVLDVYDPKMLLVCGFISVDAEKSELSVLSDIREVDKVEDPFEEVTPTVFELDMSDAVVGILSAMIPLSEFHPEDTDSDDEVNDNNVKFDGGSDENRETK